MVVNFVRPTNKRTAIVGGQRSVLFVSWTPHTRPRELARRLGGSYLVPAPGVTRWWWPIRYFIQGIATTLAILRRAPSTVLWTNPPFLAGVACLVATRIVNAQCWADCHSAAYDAPHWTRFRRANDAVLRRCTGAIFHNTVLADKHVGTTRQCVVLSTYAMQDRSSVQTMAYKPNAHSALVVAVCSYAFDEPIDSIFGAAGNLPDVSIMMTGRAPEVLCRKAPANVRFTGWLDNEAYHHLLDEASVVLCLTTREATMQNGIIEALEHQRPVITSNTKALQSWAEEVPGIATVDCQKPDLLARTVKEVVRDSHVWQDRARVGQQVARDRSVSELAELMSAMAVAS